MPDGPMLAASLSPLLAQRHRSGSAVLGPMRVRFDVGMRQETRPIVRLPQGRSVKDPSVRDRIIEMSPCELVLGIDELHALIRLAGAHCFTRDPWRRVEPVLSPRTLVQLDAEAIRSMMHTRVIVEVLDERLPWLSLVDAPLVREVRFGSVYLSDPRRVMAMIPLVRAFREANKTVSVIADDRDDLFFGHREALLAAGVSAIDSLPSS